jgi:hypothetical protein
MKKYILIILCMIVFMFAGNNKSFAQWVSPGKLSKAHTKLEGIDNCLKCHSLVEGITDSACNACHEKLVDRIKRNKGFHARVKGKCFECHTDHKGEDYDIVWIEKEKFDHKMTGYDLQDRHKLPCQDCHKEKNTYLDLKSDKCLNCHTDVHKKTASEDCITCHNFKGWKDVTFDHDKNSEYKLTGKHAEIKCGPCHYKDPIQEKEIKTGRMYRVIKFKPLNYLKCNDCHIYVHKEELKENKCNSCHVTKSWEVAVFDHNDPLLSDYRLSGRHEKVSCELCHPEEKRIYRKDGKDIERLSMKIKPVKHDYCSDCHFDVHMGQFEKQDCDVCHPLNSEWKDFTFKHESPDYTGYKLEGKHKGVECKKCHELNEIRYTEFKMEKKAVTGKFKPINSNVCDDCHKHDHKGKYQEISKLKGITCDNCHSIEKEWKEYIYKHKSDSKYHRYNPDGQVKESKCEECHLCNTQVFCLTCCIENSYRHR